MKGIILITLLFCVKIYGQISPGDLTKFHANLEGMENCTKCHDLGEKVSREKCLSCHKEIRNRISQNRGYHSNAEVRNKDCWRCHSEHNGRNFEIIHFKKNEFDHSKTGFNLTGSHQNLQCDKCHKNEFINESDLKKRKGTFLGLNHNCITCHEDYHHKALGNNCLDCHDTNKFKPASSFNHSKARYVLTGAHLTVACDKCHPKENRNDKSFQKFKGIDFKTCIDCHKDFHNGKLGNDCWKCHNTSDFNSIKEELFDHSKTNFKLVGEHESVECSECHGKNLSSKPEHDKCLSCHQDYHKGQFLKDNSIADCKLCHNENGFTPSLFTIEKHSDTKFELLGSHLAVECKSCHKVKGDWNFRLSSFRCIDCHLNIHGDEISKEFMGESNCNSCHNSDTWKKVNFDHSKTEFPLLGAHKKVECDNCHMLSEDGIKKKVFSSLKMKCESCHADIHRGQFRLNSETDCSRCHAIENWRASKFDHSKTRFPLDGAHKNVECSKCHKTTDNGKKFINYKIEDIRCVACHS